MFIYINGLASSIFHDEYYFMKISIKNLKYKLIEDDLLFKVFDKYRSGVFAFFPIGEDFLNALKELSDILGEPEEDIFEAIKDMYSYLGGIEIDTEEF